MPEIERHTIENVIERVKEHNINSDLELIKKAYKYAKKCHQEQSRLSRRKLYLSSG